LQWEETIQDLTDLVEIDILQPETGEGAVT
jgi:hypothetical protein